MGEAWVPRPDQQRALDWLLPRQRGLLLAPTGSGKTAIGATWLAQILLDEFAVERALVVAPKLVVEGWLEQIERWQHLAVLRAEAGVLGFDLLDLTAEVRSDGSRGGLTFRDKGAARRRLLGVPGRLHLCSWDALPWVEEALGTRWPYGALVLDESSFVRDMRSGRGKAARRAVHKSGKVSHVLLLTATPNSNEDEAVYAQVDLVERGALGKTLTEFRQTYCRPASQNWQTGQVYRWEITPAARPQFEAIVARHALSMPDCLGIEVVEAPVWLTLPASVRAEYDRLKRTQVLDDVTAANEAVLHGKLRQLATGWYYDDAGNAKCLDPFRQQRLLALLEEVDRPCVIAFQWQFEEAWLRHCLRTKFRDIREPGAKEAFIRGEFPYLGVHPASAGHGVDGLQAGTNHIVWVSVPEDRELYDQTNGRLKRGGQAAPTVFVHLLVTRDTVEEDVWTDTLRAKKANADRLLEATR